MLAALLLASSAATVFSAVTPNAPGPGDVFKTGGDCTLGWTPDESGKWKKMDVWFMTGPNLGMIKLKKVLSSFDGTSSTSSYSWPCPAVDPYSAIYFYQFEATGQDTAWTTRFAISDADGNTTPPTEETDGIAWGTGQILGADGTPSGNSSASGNSSSGSTSLSTSSSSSSSVGQHTSTQTVTAGPADPTGDNNSGNGASGLRVASAAFAGVLAVGAWLL